MSLDDGTEPGTDGTTRVNKTLKIKCDYSSELHLCPNELVNVWFRSYRKNSPWMRLDSMCSDYLANCTVRTSVQTINRVQRTFIVYRKLGDEDRSV